MATEYYIARNKDHRLWLWNIEPHKYDDNKQDIHGYSSRTDQYNTDGRVLELNQYSYPEITWDNGNVTKAVILPVPTYDTIHTHEPYNSILNTGREIGRNDLLEEIRQRYGIIKKCDSCANVGTRIICPANCVCDKYVFDAFFVFDYLNSLIEH